MGRRKVYDRKRVKLSISLYPDVIECLRLIVGEDGNISRQVEEIITEFFFDETNGLLLDYNGMPIHLKSYYNYVVFEDVNGEKIDNQRFSTVVQALRWYFNQFRSVPRLI